MDKSFPTFLSSTFQIYQMKKETRRTKESNKLTFLIYACFNFVINGLKLKLNAEDFFVKGKTYKAHFCCWKKDKFHTILAKLYHCYNLIIRVYEFKTMNGEKLSKIDKKESRLYTLFDDMTNTKMNESFREIEILIKDSNYYLFAGEVNFISKRFDVISVSNELRQNLLSENGLHQFLSEKYVPDFQISNLMLYSEIKYKRLEMTPLPSTSKNIVFFYSPTLVKCKRSREANLPLLIKEQYKVLDKWTVGKGKKDCGNLYIYTFFCRKENEFKFVHVDLDEKNKSFLNVSVEQIHCPLIEESVNSFEEHPMDKEDLPELRDSCFCPNLYFPMAKSSQGRPNKTIPVSTLLERLSLADAPILDLLSFAAKISIFFYDIETIARPLAAKIEQKEAKIRKFDSEKRSNYVHSIQETVCIGFQSLCPDFNIWSEQWPCVLDVSPNLVDFLNLPFPKKQRYIDQLQSFAASMRSIVNKELSDVGYMLDSCKVFELGNNADASSDAFEEPNQNSIKSMVFEWLDFAFKQAELLRLLKQIILQPLFAHVNRSTGGFKRKGDFARLTNKLQNLIGNFYIFG